MKRSRRGFLLAAAGASLWGTDALFRRGLALELPATGVVLWEHLILAFLTLPLLLRFIRARHRLTAGDVASIVFIGAGASALATTLFTEAFTYGDPTTPLLIQKVQPVVAVLGASILLGERPLPRYAVYFGFAVAGAYLISFPDPGVASIDHLAPALLALAAACLWGMGTVLGRHLTRKIPPHEITALRFAVGFVTASAIVLVRSDTVSSLTISASDMLALVLLSLVPGLAAILIYYRGLTSTPASMATLAELAFPLTAIVIGWLAFDAVPTTTQWLGIVCLSATIVVMTQKARAGSEAVGVRVPEAVVPRRGGGWTGSGR